MYDLNLHVQLQTTIIKHILQINSSELGQLWTSQVHVMKIVKNQSFKTL